MFFNVSRLKTAQGFDFVDFVAWGFDFHGFSLGFD